MASAPPSVSTPIHPVSITSYFGPVSPDLLAAAISAGPLSLNSLLTRARDIANESTSGVSGDTTKKQVHVIFGNEASDMDSMVTSIVLAWYLSSIYPPSTGNYFLPMMNIHRDELRLRSEAPFAFRQAGLNENLLLFKEDVDFRRLRSSSNVELRIILVDHNQLDADKSDLAEHVVAIIDHHRDEELYMARTQPNGNRVIDVQGSCSSMLGEVILKHAPILLSEKNFDEKIDQVNFTVPTPLGVLHLLYAVLLLDTSNLSPVTKKARSADLFVIEHYRTLIQQLTFEELKRRRADVGPLTITDLLKKDTKFGDSLKYPHMIASIPCGLFDLASKDPSNFLTLIESYMATKKMRFVILMTANMQGVFRRQVALIVKRQGNVTEATPAEPSSEGRPLADAQLFDQLHAELIATETLDLQADETLLPAEVRRATASSSSSHPAMLLQSYVQRNLTGGRKQLAPIVEKLLAKL